MNFKQDQVNLLVKILSYYQHHHCSMRSKEYEEIRTIIDKITTDVLPI